MFSRRHPFLFSLLLFTAMAGFTLIVISFLIAMAVKSADFAQKMKLDKDSVGIVEVTGAIMESETIIKHLKKFREKDKIKAIVLRIDSPGGGVGPSQEIFREVRKTTETKKVIASMGAMAASGGYYVAAGADGIVANPGSITGSIGVIMGFTNIQALMEKIGLAPVVIKSGEFKDVGSPVRKMTSKEKQFLDDLVGELHQQFIDDISKGRGMDPDVVDSYADGRIFTGKTAKELGLVDRLGNLQDAIEWAGRLGGIEGEIPTVYGREKKFSWIEKLSDVSLKKFLNRLVGQSLFAGYIYQPGQGRVP